MIAWEKTRARQAPWFLLPAALLLVVFALWPLGRAVAWSFTNADLLAPEQNHYVGFENYAGLWDDTRFRQAFANTWLFALLVVPAQTGLAFFLALWVTREESRTGCNSASPIFSPSRRSAGATSWPERSSRPSRSCSVSAGYNATSCRRKPRRRDQVAGTDFGRKKAQKTQKGTGEINREVREGARSRSF
jgi:hypothetical protein